MNERLMGEIIASMPDDLARGVAKKGLRGNNLWMTIERDHLPKIAGYIHNSWGATLVSMHAVDNRSITSDFKVCVILALKGEDDFVTLVASVDAGNPIFPSVTPEISSADWYEREINDMFGLEAQGHPDLRPLVLYDDWPKGTFPLRKDFPADSIVPRIPRPYEYRKVEGEGVFVIPVGPIHAGVIEPGHFRFSVAGEPMINLELRLGYVHKGIEKLSESMTYAKGVRLSERISGDNGFAHSLAYCQTVEAMSDAKISERSNYLRCVFAELERAYNLLGDVGGIALDTAFNVGAQHAYILKERMMDINDLLTGSRFLRGVNCVGGVRKDIDENGRSKLMERLVTVKLDFHDFYEDVIGTPSVMDRLETTGILTFEAAKDLNVVGPGARASGIDRDVRRDHPYAAYRDFSFKVPVLRQGDVNARFQVKSEEILESISIIEQAVSNMPSGELRTEVPVPEPGGTAMSLVESPRGEMMHWIVAGEGRPFRHKIRDASFHNWRAMEVAVLGNIVPDFPLVNKSFSLSYSGSDL
jgi:Ni,Fe-hydrogenase III large subunit/Ni,Fe-hydrogenase III component G